MSKDKYYITTPIFYASGDLHLGHAYTSVACDTLARWNRNIGKKVFFLTGSDEHGQKVAKKAKEQNKNPQEFTDDLVKNFQETLKKLNISYDYFIRTTNKDHKKIVQDMLQKTYDNGDIYKGKYEGLYCVDCERYYTKDELIDEKICPDHKKEVEHVSEENYFFKLSKYKDKILELYKKNPNFLSPKSKAQETINRVKEGLQDISISRNKKNLSWGIELPFDKDHICYVWFDALFNYISALKITNNLDFYPANVHVVGKDIMWFHKVYWPAFLMSTNYKFPEKIFAHGWWTVDGEKMGKSMGNQIDPVEEIEKYGLDEFRYFLLTVGTFGDDLDYSKELLIQKINNELNNDLGNLISRVHAMTNKYFNGIIPKTKKLEKIDVNIIKQLNFFNDFNILIQDLKFNQAFDLLWSKIREVNAYINQVEPYKEKNQERLSTIMNILCSSCILFAKYINCLMPEKSNLIFNQFNIKNDNRFEFIHLDKTKLNQKQNLFQKIKIEEKKVEDKKIKAIVFDFDGVIHDTFDVAFKLHMKFNPNSNKEYYKSYFDGNIFEKVDKDFNQEFHDEFRRLEYEEFKNLKLKKNIRKELKTLSKDYDLYIISSNSEKNINYYFENNNFTGIFKEILASESHKSKEEKFKIFFKKYNLNNKNSIFVTDTLGDIKEGNNIGIKTIAVDFGFHDKIRLQKANPFKIISKFEDIRRTVDELNTSSQELTDDFSQLNLKVGKIISVKEHPEAEKLYIEEIELGENQPRQIVSGLKGYYELDELKNKKVIVLCNLKPAKLMGVKSNGMILVSENEKENKLGLLTSNLEIGTNLTCNNQTSNSERRVKIDSFFNLDFTSDGNKVYFNKKEVNKVKVDRNIKGKIC